MRRSRCRPYNVAGRGRRATFGLDGDTLPIGEDKMFPQLTVLSIAPLLASTIRAVFENGSVTGLFDGDA